MKTLGQILVVVAGLVAVATVATLCGCTMATADRLEILDVIADRPLVEGDIVHLYEPARGGGAGGWYCSATVADIAEGGGICPAGAPTRVVWRVGRPGEEQEQVIGRGESELGDGLDELGDGSIRIFTCQ